MVVRHSRKKLAVTDLVFSEFISPIGLIRVLFKAFLNCWYAFEFFILFNFDSDEN